MDDNLERIYGKSEHYKDALPAGCEEVWAEPGRAHIVAKWSDGSYRAAILVDTEKRRKELSDSGSVGIKLDEDFLFYIVDAERSTDVERAKTRLEQWKAETIERTAELTKEVLEDSKRRLNRVWWMP